MIKIFQIYQRIYQLSYLDFTVSLLQIKSFFTLSNFIYHQFSFLMILMILDLYRLFEQMFSFRMSFSLMVIRLNIVITLSHFILSETIHFTNLLFLIFHLYLIHLCYYQKLTPIVNHLLRNQKDCFGFWKILLQLCLLFKSQSLQLILHQLSTLSYYLIFYLRWRLSIILALDLLF